MKLIVSLNRDEDGVWVAECPSIPDCVSQGSTKEKDLENIKRSHPTLPRSSSRTRHASDDRNSPGGGTRLMPGLPQLSGQETVGLLALSVGR
jgi:hypothetical protein